MPNELRIVPVDLLTYLRDLEHLRTPLCDFYVKTKNCLILAAYGADGRACGLLLAERGPETELLCLCAESGTETVRRTLLARLIKSLPVGERLRWRLEENSADEELARAFGFRSENNLHIFRTVTAGDPRVEEILRENERLIAFIERRGCVTKRFDELTDKERDEICLNTLGEFEASLRPASLINDTEGGFAPEMSFAAVREGRVAAYTVIRAPEAKNFIFEIVCAAKSEKKTGAFLLPVLASVKAMNDAGAESVRFAIYEDNAESFPLVTKKFGRLIASHTVRHHLIYTVPSGPRRTRR